MIISDKYRFVFIHIPKCAGTSVRKALMPYDDYNSWFTNRIDTHPDFGKLDFVHLPLTIMQKVLPAEYEKVISYDVYAIVRDPQSRFQSAFAQYLKMYQGIEIAQMEDKAIDREVENVIDILKSSRSISDPRLIHFMRQEAFLKDDLGCHVENIYPVTKIDLLLKSLSQKVGREIVLPDKQNETLILKNGFSRKQVLGANRTLKNVLPEKLYYDFRHMARRLLMRPVSGKIMNVFKKKSTLSFIESYYQNDFILYEIAQKKYNSMKGTRQRTRKTGTIA